MKSRVVSLTFRCMYVQLVDVLFTGDSVGELAQYAELFIENDINGKRYGK